jgi:hypothetical protein
LKTPVSQNAFKSVTFPKSVFLFYTSTLPYTLSKIAGQQCLGIEDHNIGHYESKLEAIAEARDQSR